MSDNKIENTINKILKEDRDEILEILESGTEDLTGGTSYSYSREISDTYEKDDEKFNFNINIVLTYMDFEKHKYEKEGQYYIEIVCEVEDTQILSDVKQEFTDFTDDLMPYIDIVIRQNYPDGILQFNEDITEEQFNQSFIY